MVVYVFTWSCGVVLCCAVMAAESHGLISPVDEEPKHWFEVSSDRNEDRCEPFDLPLFPLSAVLVHACAQATDQGGKLYGLCLWGVDFVA